MSEPIISVVVPVYNAENYIDECVQSILNQTVECYELILVNDGSTDRSGILCDTWAMDDNRIRVIHTKNGGAAKARNIGVSEAKGNYITFVDADDTVTTDYLEYLYKTLCEYRADIAVGGFEKIYPDEKGEHSYKKNTEKNGMSGYEALEKLLYQDGIMSVPWGMLIKKEILDKVKFPENTKAEDMGTIYRMFANAERVVTGKQSVYNYYQRTNNTMFSTTNERNKDYYKHSRRMVSFVKKDCPEYIMAAYNRHFSACFQILSETKWTRKNRKLISEIYKDIALLRNTVFHDRKARLQNRGAAALSLVSIRFLHLVMLFTYMLKVYSLKKLEKENIIEAEKASNRSVIK